VSDPDTYQAGISVDLVSTAPAIGTVFNTSGGIWTLTSWSTHPLNMTVEGIAFTGTWTFREYELPPPPPPPQRGRELGSLTVTKTISGDVDEAPDDTFDFTVTFAPGAPDYWNILGISVPEGAIGSNGVFTFSLKADQSMTFSNIPVGTTYTVVETSDLPDGWTAGTQTDATGSIDANGATAIIDNIYEVTGVLGDSDTEDDPNEDAAVAGDSDVLPQTGGVSAATLLGIAGIMLLGSGLAVAIIGRKKKEE
ncbi:MAG: LPXTG cell wall anchor domain-containing protein, partial [Clostridiales bacterium]|nr:LPXTG cell wall anchor domain-containing protein [Clostridiales bacterium]